MKRSKIILVVLILSMIVLIFSGCCVGGDTVAPIITGVPDASDGYVNADEAADGILVYGVGPTYSNIKIYINDILAGTGSVGAYGTWEVVVAKNDLGEDGAKTLYATAKEASLAESAPSNKIEFILDTT